MVKKVVAIILVMLVCFSLVSCGNKPSGVYYSGDRASGTYIKYDFGVSKVSIEAYVDGKKNDSSSVEGKYKIEENQLTIFYKNEKGEESAKTLYYERLDKNSIKIDSLICYAE